MNNTSKHIEVPLTSAEVRALRKVQKNGTCSWHGREARLGDALVGRGLLRCPVPGSYQLTAKGEKVLE